MKTKSHSSIIKRGAAMILAATCFLITTGCCPIYAGSKNGNVNQSRPVNIHETGSTGTFELISNKNETERNKPEQESHETENTEDTEDDSSGSTEPEYVEETLTPQEETYEKYYTEQDAIDIAKVLYRECRGIKSKTEKACVAWTILHRVDKYHSSVYEIVRAPSQYAFKENTPVWDELLDLANDVLERWNRKKNGETDVGEVLPEEFTYFEGKNGHNHFRNNFQYPYTIWDYSLESPYEN